MPDIVYGVPFADPALPGLTGIDLGLPVVLLDSEEEAQDRIAAMMEGDEEFRVVPRPNGKFRVAMIDREDKTFIFV